MCWKLALKTIRGITTRPAALLLFTSFIYIDWFVESKLLIKVFLWQVLAGFFTTCVSIWTHQKRSHSFLSSHSLNAQEAKATLLSVNKYKHAHSKSAISLPAGNLSF